MDFICNSGRDNNKIQYLHPILAMEIASVPLENLMEHLVGSDAEVQWSVL
jgi:hypothetical protein